MNRNTKSVAQYLIGVFLLLVLLPFASVARGQNTISTLFGGALPATEQRRSYRRPDRRTGSSSAGRWRKSLRRERQRRDLQGYPGNGSAEFHVNLRGE